MRSTLGARLFGVLCLLCALPGVARAQTIAAGGKHTVVAKPDGTVWTWGGNDSGQLGDGTLTPRAAPVQVPGLVNITAVAAGADHTLALNSSGTVWAWGYNLYGQLGDGTTTRRPSPVMVGGLPNVIAIAAGTMHSVALAADGTVWTWGANYSGQLGIGNLSILTSAVPLLVNSGWTASAIAAGHSHTLAVRTGGTLWAWGANGSGQLGDGTTTPRSAPVQVTGITGAIGAAGGNEHSAVVLSDGRVFTTGLNLYGQLGNNTTSRTSMAVVTGVAGVSSVSAGYYFTAARTSTGEVWAWGNGVAGQLGNGLGTNSSTPVRATIAGVVSRLAAGHTHAVAVTSTGIVFTWGSNANNQLGDGTNINRLTPVAISDIDYQWKVATPNFSVPAGTYYANQTVVVTDATTGADIHYTLNGNEPTLADPAIASGASVLIDKLETLKAKAWKTGMPVSSTAVALYTMTVQTPVSAPAGGNYTSAQTVSLSTTTSGATLRYTTDGVTTPVDPGSPAYTAPLSIATTTTLKVKGFRTGWNASAVLSTTYSMNFGTLAAPTIAPATGTYTGSVSVTLTSIAGATIYYTTNGTTPSQFSTLYTAPIAVTSSMTVRAIATHRDYTTSAVSGNTYTIAVAAPTFSPGAGTYPATQAITVTDATAGATIRYTLDGRDPADTDPVIASGATLAVGNYTLKARAWKTGATTSGVTTAAYQASTALTTAQVDGGDDRSVLVRPDGIAWAWGFEAGNGSYNGAWLPIQPSGITGVKSVSAGGSHILLATSGGSVYAWGANGNGQLGDNTLNERLSPGPALTTIATVSKVSAGATHSLALKQDGTVWAWGNNAAGQLGDNTITQRPAPVAASGLTGMTAVAAGRQFSVALKSTGVVYGWGDNSKGQVGDATNTQRRIPVLVSTPRRSVAVAIAAGDSFALALMNDGTVLAWGDNWAGQLGLGTTTPASTPVRIPALSGVTAIAAGHSHGLAITSGGVVWSWGNNINGQLGYSTGSNQTQLTPVQVPGLTGITAIGAGAGHSHAIASNGTVWSWGANDRGQLGDGTATLRPQPVPISGPNYAWKAWTPSITPSGGTYNVPQTATITNNDAAATLRYTLTGVDPVATDQTIGSGGTVPIDQSLTLKVSAWKTGAPTSEVVAAVYDLQLLPPTFTPGTGSYSGSTPVTIATPVPAATIRYTLDGTEPSVTSALYAGPITAAQTVTIKAKVFKAGWTSSTSGYASYWITAGAVAAPQFTPAPGTYADAQLVRLTSATPGATIRYTLDGSDPDERAAVYRFGLVVSASTTVKARAFKNGWTPSAAAVGAFALDAPGTAATPTLSPAGGRFTVRQTVAVQAAAGATLRYTTDGRDPTDSDPLVTGGAVAVNRSGVLKVRAWQNGASPSAVRAAFFVITGAISAGQAHTLALKSDGTVWAWGYNGQGMLGDGTNTTRYSPVPVPISDVQAIAAGFYHSLALKRDGTVWAWGYNSCGQLGDGTFDEHDTPMQVPGLTNVVAIAAGGEASGFITGHSLALKADGTVWAWGCNSFGQLGDGTFNYRPSPARVPGLIGVSAIAAHDGFSMALEGEGASAGTVWTWGDNDSGQLGDGSTLPRNVPIRLSAFADAVAIAAGDSFAMAIRRDGTLWDWGFRMSSQAFVGSAPPAPLPFLQRVLTMTGGAGGLAVTRDGWRWAWGLNGWGELGNNNACSIGQTCLLFGRVNPSPPDLQVSTASRHTVWLRTDGTVAAAGYNWYGVIGDGTQTDRAVPTPVPGFTVADNVWLNSDDDQDGLTAWREWLAGTDPARADTNGNGILDGVEESDTASALDPDTDNDGLSNAMELLLGTDPYVADSDGDGVLDGLDGFPLDPARSALPPPNPLDTTPPIIILKEPTTARPVGGGGL